MHRRRAFVILMWVAPWFGPGFAFGQPSETTTPRSDSFWKDPLSPSRVKLPTPRDKLVWLDSASSAFEQARAEGRPVFVTLRCLPCDQCAEFDKDVLEGGPLLGPLLRQFVTVRLTSMRELDLRLFPIADFQDLDLSWWGWFFDPDGRLYGVYGGRDEVSDTTRISVASLAKTMRRILAHHYDPRRASWNIDGVTPRLTGKPTTPSGLPGWSSWVRRGANKAASSECLHCHQVAEILRQPAIDAGTFDKPRDFDMWPFPENVGLVLQRDDGLRVESVTPASPAARAGLLPGDVLAAAEGRRLFSQADFRAALHRGPRGSGKMHVRWLREGNVWSADLSVAKGWRATVLDWRASVAGADVGAHPGFPWPLAVKANVRKRLGLPKGSLAVRPWFGKNSAGPAYQAGLRPHHVITKVNGDGPDVVGRAFMVWFRLQHEPGQKVELTVRERDGAARTIRFELPKRER